MVFIARIIFVVYFKDYNQLSVLWLELPANDCLEISCFTFHKINLSDLITEQII